MRLDEAGGTTLCRIIRLAINAASRRAPAVLIGRRRNVNLRRPRAILEARVEVELTNGGFVDLSSVLDLQELAGPDPVNDPMV